MKELTTVLNERTNDSVRSDDALAVAPIAEAVEREGFSLARTLRNPRTWISFALAAAIIWFVLRGLNINVAATWAYMQRANLWLYLAGFLIFYTTFPLRALRWRVLLQNAEVPIADGRKTWASTPALIEYIGLSWFANCIVPAKLGDAYRGYLLKHNGNVSFSATFGTIFAERLLDMLCLFTFLVVSAWWVFGTQLPPQTNLIFGSGLVLVVAIVAGLAGMRFFGPHIQRLVPARFRTVYASFEQAALRSFRPRILPTLIGYTAVIWLLEGFRLFFVIEALGVQGIGLPAIIFVALASSLLTALPLTPGGLAIVEGTVTVVLTTFFAVDQNLASAVTVLDRIINFWSIIVFGLILYIVSRRK